MMNKIMLCCSAGMSTSLLVRKMKIAAEQQAIDVQIDAYGASEFSSHVEDYDVVLLGPQVKYMLNDLQQQAEPFGISVKVIDMMDYGMQNGEKVLQFALDTIHEHA
ncbi:PTS sugar transporter subunit IIB [Vibrio palustris]|uniref:PTS sugar transporter subunit IIB n=1 Tax=Vibrio palustris TaxID=1918946 RepID=UPI003B848513